MFRMRRTDQGNGIGKNERLTHVALMLLLCSVFILFSKCQKIIKKLNGFRFGQTFSGWHRAILFRSCPCSIFFVFLIFFPCRAQGSLPVFAQEGLEFKHCSVEDVDMRGILKYMLPRSDISNFLSNNASKMPFSLVKIFLFSEFNGSTFDKEVLDKNPKEISQSYTEDSTNRNAGSVNGQFILSLLIGFFIGMVIHDLIHKT
jgi:hypothetical protein